MLVSILLGLLAICEVLGEPRFVSYIGQAGPAWATTVTNEEWLRYMGVPGYGGSRGYNVLNFAFWVSNSVNGGAAVNGAAYDWQNIANRITSSELKRTLTTTSNPTATQLRAGVKAKYAEANIKIFISAFGAADHPMGGGKSASQIGVTLAQYARDYLYDGVDVDWEEGQGGQSWVCELTNTLRANLNSQYQITHAPQAPYFMPRYGYATVHSTCGGAIDWYNVQFYNQGSTRYDSYNGLFQSSIGWSTNTGVYQIMGVNVPSDKLVVGKHTNGDGSTFVSGSQLKSIFDEALTAGQWHAGFMSWQFYKEVIAAEGEALIDYVLQCNWERSPTPPTTAPPPTTPPACSIRCGSGWAAATATCGSCCTSDGDCPGSYCFRDLATTPCQISQPNPTPRPTPQANTPTPRPTPSTGGGGGGGSVIRVINRAGGTKWWYTVSLSGVPNGVSIQYVRLRDDGYSGSSWITADYSEWNGGYYGFAPQQELRGPFTFQVETTAGQVVTGERVVSTYAAGQSGDVGAVSAAYKADDEDNDRISWTVWFAMSIFILLAIGIIIGICVYKKRMKKGKGYVSNNEKEIDTVELRENDGNNTVTQHTEMIEVNNEDEEEIEIEVEAEVPITTQ